MQRSSSTIQDPTNVQRCIHVEWDPETGTFTGLPEVWAKMLPDGVAQETKDTGDLPSHVAPSVPVKKAAAAPMESVIGMPFNVKHNINVKIDSHSSTGFKVRVRRTTPHSFSLLPRLPLQSGAVARCVRRLECCRRKEVTVSSVLLRVGDALLCACAICGSRAGRMPRQVQVKERSWCT